LLNIRQLTQENKSKTIKRYFISISKLVMKIKILSTDFDKVISSLFITGSTSYDYCLKYLVPLVDKLDIQRTLQDSKFYQRLERDLIKGCIMPPITIAFIQDSSKSVTEKDADKFVNENIEKAFILDGIQRLNTLNRTNTKQAGKLDLDRCLYLNILVCSSMDNLLYRMITLNNGQKPMSARHQIEILTSNLIEFPESEIPVVTEKEKKQVKLKVVFNKDVFVKGYLAFLSNSTNIENKKIIEEKMDQLIADRIMDTEITSEDIEFTEIVKLVNQISENDFVYKWLKNQNNFIGFCVGIKSSFEYVKNISEDRLQSILSNYEKAFSSFNYSQIKVGLYRRNLSSHFFKNLQRMQSMDELELIDELSQID
tara:strand:+ start:3613 stop:4719 length:1107 start_codon:yes stop_codon:yes gene_type:complete